MKFYTLIIVLALIITPTFGASLGKKDKSKKLALAATTSSSPADASLFAAISWGSSQRIYSIENGKVIEHANDGSGWYIGAFPQPYGVSVAAAYIIGGIRVYVTGLNGVITEYCWSLPSGGGWSSGGFSGSGVVLNAISDQAKTVGSVCEFYVYVLNNGAVLEYVWNSGWGSTTSPVSASALTNSLGTAASGLSTISWGSGPSRRIYSVENGKVIEHANDGGSWYTGAFPQPSGVAVVAVYIIGGIRVYVTGTNGAITEWCYDFSSGTWGTGSNIGSGTVLSAASDLSKTVSIYCVFYVYVLNNGAVQSNSWNSGWSLGNSVPVTGTLQAYNPPTAPSVMGSISWGSGPSRRVYTVESGKVIENANDGSGWYTGAFPQPSGVSVAAVYIIGGIRVYVSDASGNITEWCYDFSSGTWGTGSNLGTGEVLSAASDQSKTVSKYCEFYVYIRTGGAIQEWVWNSGWSSTAMANSNNI